MAHCIAPGNLSQHWSVNGDLLAWFSSFYRCNEISTLLQCTHFHQISLIFRTAVISQLRTRLGSWALVHFLADYPELWHCSPVIWWWSSITAVNREISVSVGLDTTWGHKFLIQNWFTESIITNQYITVWHWSLDLDVYQTPLLSVSLMLPLSAA